VAPAVDDLVSMRSDDDLVDQGKGVVDGKHLGQRPPINSRWVPQASDGERDQDQRCGDLLALAEAADRVAAVASARSSSPLAIMSATSGVSMVPGPDGVDVI
jgi:hypothetical protein